MTSRPSVHIVIPLYNEEKILRKSVDTVVSFLHIRNLPYEIKIILANNGSSDGSWGICQDLSKQHPAVESFEVGAKGKGLAIRKVWERSDADVLVFMDADLSSDLHFLSPLIHSVVAKENHVAIGNRLGIRSQVISKKRTRKMASWAYNAMVRWLLGTSFDDHQCGFKAIRKDSFVSIAPQLQEKGFFFDTELLTMAVRKGFIVDSIDIIWRDTDESKVSLFGDSLRMFWDIVRLRRRLKHIHL